MANQTTKSQPRLLRERSQNRRRTPRNDAPSHGRWSVVQEGPLRPLAAPPRPEQLQTQQTPPLPPHLGSLATLGSNEGSVEHSNFPSMTPSASVSQGTVPRPDILAAITT
jgi:hypothetical protein